MSGVTPCRDPQYDPNDWFIGEDGKHPTPKVLEVKARCTQDCPLYHSCAEFALKEGVPFGIWGGMSGADRRHVWRTDTRQYPMGRPQTFDRLMDSLLPKAGAEPKTHCPQGHELRRPRSGGAAYCPTCQKAQKERRRAS